MDTADQKIYVGLATGEVTQFQIQDGDLIRVSTRPIEPIANVTCGSVTSLAMHNSNVLIAWENCLLEQEGEMLFWSAFLTLSTILSLYLNI